MFMLYCVTSGILKSLKLLLKVKRTRHLADVVNAVVSTPNASPTRRSRVMSRDVTVTLYTRTLLQAKRHPSRTPHAVWMTRMATPMNGRFTPSSILLVILADLAT